MKQKYVSDMGEPLGSLFTVLWQEMARIYHKWSEFVELFGTNPSRIDILNSVAPNFFGLVQGMFWEDILLHIARVTDRCESAGRSNLTIQRIPGLITDCDIRAATESKVCKAIDSSKFCRDWRNRWIAHYDLELAVDESAKPLAPASRTQVIAALSSIADVLNTVERHYSSSTTMFDFGGPSPGGARSLLKIAEKAASEILVKKKI